MKLFGSTLSLLLASAAGLVANSFPITGIMPKEEIGALKFLEAHPEYDGRGVVVAIFDTGVDPGAEGLQKTSDGKPKIIDMIDGSGDGDVDTSTTVTTKDDIVTGLTGRKLKIDPKWKGKEGKFHIGIKQLYELFPKSLTSRVKKERRKTWDRRQRQLLDREKRRLADFDKRFPKPKKTQKKHRVELEERIKQLKSLQSKYNDPGPVCDCVVFHDGKVWRAVIDTDEDGDLTDEKVMTNFRLERQFATFSSLDLLNFAVNIYENGNRLSIVTDCGTHGTHVAGIVAGNYPGQPELNGVAPGAQIVSVKIGDSRSRSGSSSNGTGGTRGIISVLQNKADLVNLSYGGDNLRPNQNRHGRLYSELVNKHGVIFCSSAGNNGPALSTVGTPGGTTSALIGVGAYVSSQMMKVQYSLREDLPGINFTWSSRGPTFDGDIGVDICAPGAAIAPVSNWALQRNSLKNGTSMSSPNACGAIALLLSAAKAEKLAYTPHRIKRALVNTAKPIETVSVFAQGAGMIRINKAWEYLKEHRRFTDQDLRFEIKVTNRDNARGIYLREPFEFVRPVESIVTITPRFHEKADNRKKVKFEMRFNLECDADWVSKPDHLLMMHGGRYFRVRVDGSKLKPGTHYTEIRALDANNPDRGPVFRVPITVLKPEAADDVADVAWREELKFSAGELERRFIAVPAGAEWADLRVVTRDQEAGRRMVVHGVQKVPGRGYSSAQSHQYLTLKDNDERVISFPVTAGRTLELCLGQYWSSLGEGEYTCELRFHGLTPSSRHVYIDGSESATRVDVRSDLRNEEISPTGSLTTWRQTILPSDFKLQPLDSRRDRLPEDRQIYAANLTYNINAESSGKARISYALNDEMESGIFVLYDAQKRRTGNGTSGTTVSLKKGGNVLKLHVRTDRQDLLEKAGKLSLQIERTLSKSISLSFYKSRFDARTGGSRFSSQVLAKGDTVDLHIGHISSLPKGVKPGDVLRGNISFGKVSSDLLGAGKRPGGFSVSYRVPPTAVAKKSTTTSSRSSSNKSETEQLRELRLARLAKLYSSKSTKEFNSLAAQLLKSKANDIDVLTHQLKRADQEFLRKKDPFAVVTAADAIIKTIDVAALRAHYGVNLDPDDEAAGKKRKEMDKDKTRLIDALHRKARALAAAEDANTAAREAKKKETPFKLQKGAYGRALRELKQWVSLTDEPYLTLHIRNEKRARRNAGALKHVQSRIAKASKPDRKLIDQKIELLEFLGWKVWADYERKQNILRWPRAYQPF